MNKYFEIVEYIESFDGFHVEQSCINLNLVTLYISFNGIVQNIIIDLFDIQEAYTKIDMCLETMNSDLQYLMQ